MLPSCYQAMQNTEENKIPLFDLKCKHENSFEQAYTS